MVRAVWRIEQRIVTFRRRESGMTNSWKKRKSKSSQTILELSQQDRTTFIIGIDNAILPKSTPTLKTKRSTQEIGWYP